MLVIYLCILKFILYSSHGKQSIFPNLSDQLAFGKQWRENAELEEGRSQVISSCLTCFVGYPEPCWFFVVSAAPRQPPTPGQTYWTVPFCVGLNPAGHAYLWFLFIPGFLILKL